MKKAEQITLKNVPSKNQMSETFINNVFLALSGGLQDAYTYNTRDGVFSNAQTGNVVLMSQGIMAGEWKEAVRYMIPLLAFALGVFVTERIQYKHKYDEKIHWRQIVLVIQIILLFLVGLFPQSMNVPANAMMSFSCAMQVNAFRKFHGIPCATTMCIGNMRSATEMLCKYQVTGNQELKKKSMHYYFVILVFAVGAAMGALFIRQIGDRTIWIAAILLLAGFVLMFIKEDREYVRR